MASYVDFHTQLASIMEVFANAAVAEICQLIDEDFATLRLEITRSHRENLALKSRLRHIQVRPGEQPHREPGSPPLDVTCTGRANRKKAEARKTGGGPPPPPLTEAEEMALSQNYGRPVAEGIPGGSSSEPVTHQDTSAYIRYVHFAEEVKSSPLEKTDIQQSQPVMVPEQPLEPELVVIKGERLEEELTGCRLLEDHQTPPNSSIGPPALSLSEEGDHPLSVEAESPRVSASGWDEKQGFARAEAQQQVEREGVVEASTLDLYSKPAEIAPRDSGPNRGRKMTDLTEEEEKNIVDPCDSLSAEYSSSEVPDVETQLESELSLTNTGVKGLCGAAADWRGETVSTAVKLESEPSWAEAFRTPLVSLTRSECVSNSRLTNTNSHHHIESGAAEPDTSSLDSCSIDDLFSSPEVAQSLTAPHRHSTDGVTGMEKPLSSSSFSFLSDIGNSSMSDSLTTASFSKSFSDSRSRDFPSSTKRVFSCQQCTHLFSTSRDLVVHQRSHAGEKIYHCHLCKKPFIHPHQLKTHQRVHTGEKPFSCALCGKRFSQSSHIKRHMSVHTGEKRYSCSLCGKHFSQACSLKVHQAVHTGEKPYSCTKCGKSFSVLGNLVRHHSVHIIK